MFVHKDGRTLPPPLPPLSRRCPHSLLWRQASFCGRQTLLVGFVGEEEGVLGVFLLYNGVTTEEEEEEEEEEDTPDFKHINLTKNKQKETELSS